MKLVRVTQYRVHMKWRHFQGYRFKGQGYRPHYPKMHFLVECDLSRPMSITFALLFAPLPCCRWRHWWCHEHCGSRVRVRVGSYG